MEAAPTAKPRRDPIPIPPNYVSLQQLRELRLKEKEEAEEKRRREEEEEAAAAAKRAAALKAEEAAAVKREAALKAETKGRAVSRGANERHGGGQGHRQWVAVGYRAPETTPRPTATTCGEVAAREKERIVEGNRGKKGPDDIAGNASHPHGGCKSPGKGKGRRKGKKKASSCHTVGEPGNLADEGTPAASIGGKPENKSGIKAMGNASVAPLEAGASSPGHLTCKGRKGAGGRSAETSPGDAPAKTIGPSPPPGVKSGNTGKPKPAAPRLADAAGTGSDSQEGKEAAPVQASLSSAADGSSKQKTVEAKPEGLVGGQLRQPAWVARRSSEPWRRRGNGAAEPHGCVWVPKDKTAAAAAVGSSAGGGFK